MVTQPYSFAAASNLASSKATPFDAAKPRAVSLSTCWKDVDEAAPMLRQIDAGLHERSDRWKARVFGYITVSIRHADSGGAAHGAHMIETVRAPLHNALLSLSLSRHSLLFARTVALYSFTQKMARIAHMGTDTIRLLLLYFRNAL